MSLFNKCRNFTDAEDAIKMGIYPYFHALETKQDTEVVMEGKRRIMLGSNNYLGLTSHPDVIQAGIDAYEKYGSGCSGSRFLNGTLDLHLVLERELAEFFNKESVITFSTGFQTNLGIISALVGLRDYILSDKENHASIYDAAKLSYGKRLLYKHNDMDDLERILKTLPHEAGKLIVTDGVFSMRGDIAKLPEIVELAEKYNARVMVDDAHALGVIGEGGRGTADYFGLADKVDIYMGTFSKSLASLGGYMAADRYVVEYVKHNSRPFIFSASITPANTASALAALRILKEQPSLVDDLARVSNHLRAAFRKRNVPFFDANTPIIPVYTRDVITTLTVAKAIYEQGVYLNPVLPPATLEDECLLRINCMATHSEELIEEAADIIAGVLAQFGLLTDSPVV